MRFHLGAGIIALCLSLIVKLSAAENVLLFVIIGSVMALEAVNSAIEQAVDLAAKGKISVTAKYAKDMSAGAVLIMAFFALLSGILMFFTKERAYIIFDFFKNNSFAAAVGIIFIILWLIWVFKSDFSKISMSENKKEE